MKSRAFAVIFFAALVLSMQPVSAGVSGRPEALTRAKELYSQGQYRQACSLLEEYFGDSKITQSNPSDDYDDPVVAEGRNLLGDCYRLVGRLDLSHMTFRMSVEQNYSDIYAKYNNGAYWFMAPLSLRDSYLIEAPEEFTREGPSQFSVFHALLAALDVFYAGGNPTFRAAEKMLSWGESKPAWIKRLLEWHPGQQGFDIRKISEEVDRDDLARVYFYVGLKYEVDRNWEKAREWYSKAAYETQSRVIEVILAQFCLGRFDIGPIDDGVYESSATLVERAGQGYQKHRVGNLYDKDLSTAWAVTSPRLSEEWVHIGLFEKHQVAGIEIVNGYAKSSALFKKNCRVKTLRLIFPDGSVQRIALRDSMAPQYFKIGKAIDSVKIVVDEIYQGDQYNDLCISELRLKY